MWTDDEILERVEEDLKSLVLREFIRGVFPNFDDKKTYIIYDRKYIEEFDENFFKIKDRFGHFSSYTISKPLRLPGSENVKTKKNRSVRI
jgi:hypothetical protein